MFNTMSGINAVIQWRNQGNSDMVDTRVYTVKFAGQKTARQNGDVSRYVSPIIEALQFQDRISQTMDCIGRSMVKWLEFRAAVGDADSLTEEQKIAFGTMLLKLTTMKEERDVIRENIPTMPQEEETPVANVLFF